MPNITAPISPPIINISNGSNNCANKSLDDPVVVDKYRQYGATLRQRRYFRRFLTLCAGIGNQTELTDADNG